MTCWLMGNDRIFGSLTNTFSRMRGWIGCCPDGSVGEFKQPPLCSQISLHRSLQTVSLTRDDLWKQQQSAPPFLSFFMAASSALKNSFPIISKNDTLPLWKTHFRSIQKMALFHSKKLIPNPLKKMAPFSSEKLSFFIPSNNNFLLSKTLSLDPFKQ